MLVQVMQRERLRTFYTSGFPLLFETFYVQEKLMDLFIPSVRKRLVTILFLIFNLGFFWNHSKCLCDKVVFDVVLGLSLPHSYAHLGLVPLPRTRHPDRRRRRPPQMHGAGNTGDGVRGMLATAHASPGERHGIGAAGQ